MYNIYSYSCHNNIIKMPQFYVVFFSVLAQHSWETSIWFPWLHVGTNYCQLFPANLCYYWRIWYLPVQVKVCYRGKLCSDCKYSSSWPWNSNFTDIYFSTTYIINFVFSIIHYHDLCSQVMLILDASPGRFKSKIIKLSFAASLLSMQH